MRSETTCASTTTKVKSREAFRLFNWCCLYPCHRIWEDTWAENRHCMWGEADGSLGMMANDLVELGNQWTEKVSLYW